LPDAKIFLLLNNWLLKNKVNHPMKTNLLPTPLAITQRPPRLRARSLLLPALAAVLMLLGGPNARAAQMIFDVKAFGAIGNGNADDTYAIQTAINNMTATLNATTGAPEAAVLNFPDGIYKTTLPLALTLNATKGKTILIRGTTPGNCTIKRAWGPAGPGLFQFNVSGKVVVNVEDVTLAAGIENAGAAIEIDRIDVKFRKSNVIVRNVNITTLDAGYFNYGVKSEEYTNPKLFNVNMTGEYGTNGTKTFAGVYMSDGAFGCDNCIFKNMTYGVWNEMGGEGGSFSYGNITNVDYGVHIDISGGGAAMSNSGAVISYSTISAKKIGVDIDYKRFAKIENNVFDNGAGADAVYTDIKFQGSGKCDVAYNKFQGADSANRKGVWLLKIIGGTWPSDDNIISDNDFSACSNMKWVDIGVDCERNAIFNNGYGTLSKILNNGTSTFVQDGTPTLRDPDAAHVTVPVFHWGDVDPNIFNVKNAPYNATGDGITDDTAAIQAAADAMMVLLNGPLVRNATLFFPAGTYVIKNRINMNGTKVNGSYLRIAGDGRGISKILRDTGGTPGVFYVTNSDHRRVDVQNLSINSGANYTARGDAIYVSQGVAPSNQDVGRSLNMYCVDISGDNSTYFDNGVHGVKLHRTLIYDVDMEMAYKLPSTASTGIKLENANGFEAAYVITKDQLSTGINITCSATANRTVLLRKCNANGPDNGFVINGSNKTDVGIYNSHPASDAINMNISNVRKFTYSSTETLFFTTNSTGRTLKLTNCTNAEIYNNQFQNCIANVSPQRRTVWLAGGTSSVLLYSNQFNEPCTSIYTETTNPAQPGPNVKLNLFGFNDIANIVGPYVSIVPIYALNGLVNDPYILINRETGFWLRSFVNGTVACSGNDTSSNYQRWYTSYDTPTKKYYFKLCAAGGDYLQNNITSGGAEVVDCKGNLTANATKCQWEIVNLNNAYYALKANNTKYLRAFGVAVAANATDFSANATQWQLYPLGSIGGRVFYDENGNQTYDGNDIALNVTVFLDTNNDGYMNSDEMRTTTNATDGTYKFVNLPGVGRGYNVREWTHQAGYTHSTWDGEDGELDEDGNPVANEVWPAVVPSAVQINFCDSP
jgi:hypothetical protein